MLPETGALPDKLYRKRQRMDDGTIQIIVVRTMRAEDLPDSDGEENAAAN